MAIWPTWIDDFLAAASLPETVNNRKFLIDWNQHANTDCRNNPVDVSRQQGNSTNCAALPGTSRHAQNYTSHGQSSTAFNHQLHSGNFPHLLAALKSGNPYTVTDFNAVASDLNKWGSGVFATVYHNEVVAAQGGGGSSGGGRAPRAHSGWHDLQHSVNRDLPDALDRSERHVRAALRTLSHARKVRL